MTLSDMTSQYMLFVVTVEMIVVAQMCIVKQGFT
jgi:hypothetical protein